MRSQLQRCLLCVLLSSCTAATFGQAIAYVDGKPIPREELVDLLMEAHGLDALQQIILLRLAKTEAEQRGIHLTQRDLDNEWNTALTRISPDDPELPPSENQRNRENALRFILEQRNLTEVEFRMSTDRNAYLRKIIEPQVTVNEQTLKEEYERTYGARVEVRHIEIAISDRARLTEAQTMLQRGESFDQVARRVSQNRMTAPRGGLLEPFTFDDKDIPSAIREKAFNMLPGEVSNPIRVDKVFQILKLERRLPANGVPFEQVRAEVEANLRDRVAQEKLPELMNQLFHKSKIQILDPKLREKYSNMVNAGNQGG